MILCYSTIANDYAKLKDIYKLFSNSKKIEEYAKITVNFLYIIIYYRAHMFYLLA